MNKQELAKMIDQTLLKPYVSLEDLRRHCVQAAEYGFKTVAINNAPVPFCKAILKDSGVLVHAAVSFPLGHVRSKRKVFETQDVIAKGADEVDYVVNLVELKAAIGITWKKRCGESSKACNAYGLTSKVIFENCYLTDDEKKSFARLP